VTRLLLRVWKTNHHVIFLLAPIPNPCLTLPISSLSPGLTLFPRRVRTSLAVIVCQRCRISTYGVLAPAKG
jgi:hypothetical protein